MFEPIEKIPLPNGLMMEVWDRTQAIAADTTRVKLVIRVKIEVKPEYFLGAGQYDLAVENFGKEMVYEYVGERTFVDKSMRDNVFKELLETFKKNVLPYLSKPHFPARFVLSRYADMEQNPWKYSSRLRSGHKVSDHEA